MHLFDCSYKSFNEKMYIERRRTLTNLKYLLDLFITNDVLSIERLMNKFQSSERKIRQLLSELRTYENDNGFKIKTLTRQGYYLQILDNEKFSIFKQQINTTEIDLSTNKQYRTHVIISLLLQNKQYITLQEVAEILDVSRNTIIKDMESIKLILNVYDLQLVSKSHYGIKLVGDEIAVRKLLSNLLLDPLEHQSNSIEYFEFVNNIKLDVIQSELNQLLQMYDIVLHPNAIKSIMIHLSILLYRISQNNKINEICVNKEIIGEQSYQLASALARCIQDNFQVVVQNQEIDLLASQIFGKIISNEIPLKQRVELQENIHSTLERIDTEYATSFSEDLLLMENLLLHVYPLLLRATFGLELSNSLITSISAQYTNSFLISLRFIEYHPTLKQYKLSRDEIGYIALHFATHYERNNQQILNAIHNIVILSDTLPSNLQLMQIQIQSVFPNANIRIKRYIPNLFLRVDEIDLILSTIRLEAPYTDITVIIPAVLNDSILRELKNKILFQIVEVKAKAPTLERLFYEDIFFHDTSDDYLAILQKYSARMVNLGYANADFPNSVLLRETRFSTIYENGIAAPHSLQQNANIDSICVVILKQPIRYEDREVRCIFILNIRAKHLFLHQEISSFIVRIMSNSRLIDLIIKSNSFQEFKIHMKEIW